MDAQGVAFSGCDTDYQPMTPENQRRTVTDGKMSQLKDYHKSPINITPSVRDCYH